MSRVDCLCHHLELPSSSVIHTFLRSLEPTSLYNYIHYISSIRNDHFGHNELHSHLLVLALPLLIQTFQQNLKSWLLNASNLLFSNIQCLFSLPSPFARRVRKCFTWRRVGGWLKREPSHCDRHARAQGVARFSTQSVGTDGQLWTEARTVLANCVALWTSDCVRFR